MKKILSLIGIVVVAGIVVTWAILYSDANRRTAYFKRNFINSCNSIRYFPHNNRIRGISGIVDGDIYYYTNIPDEVFVYDTAGNFRKTILSKIDSIERVKINGAFTSATDGKNIYTFAMNAPGIYIKSIFFDSIKFIVLKTLFTRGVLCSNNSIVLRSYKMLKVDQVFSRLDVSTGKTVLENGISEPTKDGGISNDGNLNYDETTSSCVYVPFYRSYFQCFDFKFRNYKKFSTIDRSKAIKVDVRAINRGNRMKITNFKPLFRINGVSCAQDNRVYIQSRVESNNENFNEFKGHYTIDVYNESTGAYQHSFYIPRRGPLLQIEVADHTIITCYKGQTEILTLPE